MGTAWFAVWTVFVIFQVSSLLAAEESCVPGFQSNLLIFKVSKRHLMQGTRLGEVAFTDCTDRTRFLFSTDDGRFMVQTDGQLTVKRQVVLHGGHQDFFIHSWDSQGRKMTVHVMVLHHEHHHNHHQNVDHHHGAVKHHNQQHNLTTNTERAEDPQVPILSFPKSTEGLKRWKRAWIIPPLSVSENHRGPYPFKIAQIRSDGDKTKKIFYSITGPGADQAPVNLFTMNRDNGNLYVTQVLDREKQHNYTLQAHAVADGSGDAEKPMEIIVIVIDQNDNKPVFEKSTYIAQVPEASKKGFEVIQVVATDADEPNTDNSDIGYRIMSQDPEKPDKNMFSINPVTGAIIVNDERLDREKYPQYKLIVNAADLKGEGLIGSTEVIIKVTDSNDHAPVFTQDSYTAKVEENKVNAVVVRMSVTDGDEPHTPAWNAKFKIIDGDPGNLFSVTTGTNKQEGTITTVQGLDFEKVSKHTLLVAVVNDIDFAVPLTTSTATVTVNVQDVNEPPIFDPQENHVSKSEDVKPGSEVVFYTASDPDTARKQKVMYKIISDPAGWLEVKKDTGLITVKTEMDRESVFVQDNIYTALIGAYDDDQVPATGTGTLLITLQDVNDNAPTIEEREFTICNRNPVPQLLSVTDKDGPGFTSPYRVTLGDTAKANWTAQMNGTRTGIILNLKMELESGLYHVALSVADNQGLSQINTVTAQVCDCTGEDKNCQDRMGVVAGSNLPVILGVLAAILLLLLVVLLMLFARKGKQRKGPPLLQDDDDTRDNIFNYAEEGGGEEDQEYNLGTLHLGLDNRPMVMRDDVAPIFMPAPQYKPRPANPDDIGNFIVDNLKAADNDPTAPPYDSLLVFDYEGGGSEAGSLSSLNSSKSGDQDYNCLNEWGPRFKKLADMYGGGEDDDML